MRPERAIICRDELHALAELAARDARRHPSRRRHRGLGGPPGERALRDRGRSDRPSGSARCLGDPGLLQGQRVHVDGVAAPVADEHGMGLRDRVQVVAGQEPALRRLGVVVLEADHPLTRRRLRRSLRRASWIVPMVRGRSPPASGAGNRRRRDGNGRRRSRAPRSCPPRSSFRVRAVARFRTSSSAPTARSRPPAIATACARGCAGSMVRTLPPCRTSSASVREPGSRAKAPNEDRKSRRPVERATYRSPFLICSSR